MAGKFKLFLMRRNVKQVELADALGWTESKVSGFASGRKVPKDNEVAMIATALQMPEDKLRKSAGW